MSPENALITLADDNVAITALLSELLVDEGYATIRCSSGREAVDVIQREQPDLVITDLQMECQDVGVHVIRQMRANPATATIPVILYSGDSGSLREQAAGLCDLDCTILEKPFSMDRLLAKVAECIGSIDLGDGGAN